MAKRKRKRKRTVRVGRSRQRKHGGGKFKSERQRRAMWKFSPSAARRWAHNTSAKKDPSWPGMKRIKSVRRAAK